MASTSLFKTCGSCGKDISIKAVICPACGVKIKKITSLQWAGIGVCAFILLNMCSSNDKSSESNNLSSAVISSIPEKGIEEQIAQNLSIDFTWRADGFGSIMMASFTIKNDSSKDIKDIEIRCEHTAKSGTRIDSNVETIYDVVKAGTKRTFKEVNMGFIHSQVDSSSCNIKSFKLN